MLLDELDPEHKKPRKPGLFARMRGNFLAGLVVIAPIGLTMWLTWSVVGWIDSWVLPFVPYHYRPEQYVGINLRGVGMVFFLLFTMVIGWMGKGILGRSFLRWG
jgi:uncharacterized membrane protein